MTNPMVSIIIPVYNGSNYLKDAIDSALAQTYSNIEVIVVNDGSNDNSATEQIALSYGKKIRYFAKKNGGVATALNMGIRKMRGEYFSWLSHDDLYNPDKLAVQIEALKENGNMQAIVYSDYDLVDMLRGGTKTSYHHLERYTPGQLTASVFPVLFSLIHGCTLLIHKSHFARVGLFDEALITSQDYDLWFRMFRGQRLVFVPRCLISGRLHPEQGTNTLPSYREESGHFFIKATMSLSMEEVYDNFGHPIVLYLQTANILRNYGMADEADQVMKRYRALAIPDDIQLRLDKFCTWLSGLCGEKRICVFCCGYYGKQLYYELSEYGFAVDCFSDSDPQLWGRHIVEGCRCISLDELREISKDMLIIVAVRTPTPILTQLEQMGCPYVMTKLVLDGQLYKMLE